MSSGPLITEIGIIFFLVAFLLHKYGNWSRHHILVTINVFIAWYFAFIIISILPMDVSSTIYRQCVSNLGLTTTEISVTTPGNETVQNGTNNSLPSSDIPDVVGDYCEQPWSIVSERVLPRLWRVVYWTAQALTWIVLPLMQSYSTAGDFTVTGKLKTAIVDNVIYYGSYLVIFAFFFTYLAIRSSAILDGPNLKVVCVTASNTWGLFLLILLLGYGLVEVPRSCWNTTKKGFTLSYLYFKASKLSSEKCEAEEKVDDLLEELQQISSSIPNGHPVQQNVDLIIEKFPESKKNVCRNRRSSDSLRYAGECIGLKTLAKLHKQAIRAIHMFHRTHCQWNMLCERAFYWEDVVRNEKNRDRLFKHLFLPTRPSITRLLYTPKIEWYWQFVFRNWVFKSLAVILAVFSFIVVWSEMTFFTQHPVLSLFAVFIQSAKTNYIFIEIISMCTIAYLCFCAYYTVFRVRVLNYYYLAPHHQTNEYSLIFCGMMLTRLTPPLCLNFLSLIHLDSHVTKIANIEETAYTKIMGHLDLIPIVSDFFNIYFPILVVFVCLATYFKLGSRFLHCVGFEQFVENDDMTIDLIEEGKELIRREKNKRLRIQESEARRRDHGRLTGSTYKKNITTARDTSLNTTPVEENPHSELLRNVEPVDYTEERGSVAHGDDKDASYSYVSGTEHESSAERDNYYSLSWNRIGRPNAGLFDDV